MKFGTYIVGTFPDSRKEATTMCPLPSAGKMILILLTIAQVQVVFVKPWKG